jgi:hypothetical protein
VSTNQKGPIELVGKFFEVRAQVDRDLTTVSWVDRLLGLIKNLGRHRFALRFFDLGIPTRPYIVRWGCVTWKTPVDYNTRDPFGLQLNIRDVQDELHRLPMVPGGVSPQSLMSRVTTVCNIQ